MLERVSLFKNLRLCKIFSKIASLNTKMKEREPFKFDKPVPFSNGVLIGNWVEDRLAYKKNDFNHKSVYSHEFGPKSFDNDKSSFIWDQKFRTEGQDFISANLSTDPCTYHDNYSTIYDLSYKYFPNWYHGPFLRKLRFRFGTHEPQDEYLQSYGNLKYHGLLDYKRNEWKCDRQDPRTTLTTSYEDQFPPHNKSDYTYAHWTRKTPQKDKHPSLSNCNILTWECKDECACE